MTCRKAMIEVCVFFSIPIALVAILAIPIGVTPPNTVPVYVSEGDMRYACPDACNNTWTKPDGTRESWSRPGFDSVRSYGELKRLSGYSMLPSCRQLGCFERNVPLIDYLCMELGTQRFWAPEDQAYWVKDIWLRPLHRAPQDE